MDGAAIIKPFPLSPKGGTFDYISLPWDGVAMPSRDRSYRVFKIGQLPRQVLNIETQLIDWVRVDNVCNANQLQLDIYLQNGVQIPKVSSYLRITKNRTVLIAVQEYAAMPDIYSQPIFLRFYRNSYFSSTRVDELAPPVFKVVGAVITSVADTLVVLNEFYNHSLLAGHTELLINGISKGYLIPGQVKVGDVLEMVYDSTVYRDLRFTLSDLPTFESTLDEQVKYLIHPTKTPGEELINYRDDVDITLMQLVPGSETEYYGVTYHYNRDFNLRMVTHQDYSLSANAIDAFINSHNDHFNTNELIVNIRIKRSGYARPLIFEANKVHELYKLPDDEIVSHIQGLNANVPFWHAPHLEASSYTAVMRFLDVPGEIHTDVSDTVFRDLTIEALGYNALVNVLAKSPVMGVLDGGAVEFKVPYAYRHNSTVYEYNASGRLTGFFYHTSGTEYYPNDEDTVQVEFVVGIMSDVLDQQVAAANVQLTPNVNTRYYLYTATEPSALDGTWEDVTGSDNYSISNGNVVWDIDTRLQTPIVRGNGRGLGLVRTVEDTTGYLYVPLTATYKQGGVEVSDAPLLVSLGKLDVWLNGYPLVRDVDFTITEDFTVIITNKSRTVAGNSQEVMIRFMNHCTETLTQDVEFELGYVRHGALSRNNRFDVRDDKNVRIVSEGKLIHKDQLVFSEDNNLTVNGLRDGAIYAIEYQHPPIHGVAEETMVRLKQTAGEYDVAVSNILTDRLPEEPNVAPIVSTERHTLYSVVTAAILKDMRDRRLTSLTGRITDEDLDSIFHPYRPLLEFDVTQQDINPALISIHPHPFRESQNISIEEYAVLDRIISRYLNNRVDLTQFVTVGVL